MNPGTTVEPHSLKEEVRSYHICDHCRVIDRDHERVISGHLCGTCGKPGDGGRMYFEVSVHTLAALIEDAAAQLANAPADSDTSKTQSVAVVIFFCTTRELLLTWLIQYVCWAQRIPLGAFERLMADNKWHAKRQYHLLPSLVGKKWKALIEQETAESANDYVVLNDLLERSSKARNSFMHEGRSWSLDRTLAAECVEQFPVLLSLYAALHNRYVHPVHLKESGTS